MLNRITLLSLFAAVLSLAACSDALAPVAPEGSTSGPAGGKGDEFASTSAVMSWEDFRSLAYCEPDRDVCVVEGDLPIAGGEAGLRSYYDTRIAGSAALSVYNSEGADLLWPRQQRFDLTYCVSDEFGGRKNEVVEALESAAGSWEEAGHLAFEYIADADSSCNRHTRQVLFRVLPAPSDATYFARAFFPGWAASEREVRVNLDTFDRVAAEAGSIADNLTLTGILRHELGHVLGFRHEHTRPETRVEYCYEDEHYRVLTEYDASSVMHYPQCGGDGDWSLEMTDADHRGVAFLYPDLDSFPTGRCAEELDSMGEVNEDCAPVVRQIVELANQARFDVLDDWAGLDRRAVEDILAHRLERPFHTLDDLTEMRFLGPAGVRKIYDWLYVDGRCPQDVEFVAWEDGVSVCWPMANRILELAHNGSLAELDHEVGLDRRAAEYIVAERALGDFQSLSDLWLVPYVKTRALRKLYEYLYP